MDLMGGIVDNITCKFSETLVCWSKLMQKSKVVICMGSSCFARGNEENLHLFEDFVQKHDLSERVHLSGRCCAFQCAEGPNISIDGVIYNKMQAEALLKLLEEKFL